MVQQEVMQEMRCTVGGQGLLMVLAQEVLQSLAVVVVAVVALITVPVELAVIIIPLQMAEVVLQEVLGQMVPLVLVLVSVAVAVGVRLLHQPQRAMVVMEEQPQVEVEVVGLTQTYRLVPLAQEEQEVTASFV
jgi:hypothetical protein